MIVNDCRKCIFFYPRYKYEYEYNTCRHFKPKITNNTTLCLNFGCNTKCLKCNNYKPRYPNIPPIQAYNCEHLLLENGTCHNFDYNPKYKYKIKDEYFENKNYEDEDYEDEDYEEFEKKIDKDFKVEDFEDEDFETWKKY